jgi:hypothetical protein
MAATLLLLASFGLTAQVKDNREPSVGRWPDGTTILWLCPLGVEGKVRIIVIAPNGAQYPAELECLPKNQKSL